MEGDLRFGTHISYVLCRARCAKVLRCILSFHTLTSALVFQCTILTMKIKQYQNFGTTIFGPVTRFKIGDYSV